jgi:vitamin B12 transporter
VRPDRRWRLRCAAILALAAGAAPPLAAQFPAELAGQVVDAATRAPVPSARVRVPANGLAVETDAAGRFRLKGVPAGEWEIEVAAIGYHPARRRVSLTDGRVERATVTLDPRPVGLAPITVTAGATPGPGVSVIGRGQIENTLAPDVAALLEGQPGLTITRKGGPGSPAAISIRGSAPHQVLVLVDDVPLNDPTTGEVDLAALPLEQVERVTIVRGAAVSRYGPRALAGAVAIERRRATASDGWLTLGAGAWGERSARAGGSLVHQRDGRTMAGSLSGGFTRFDGDFGYDVPAIRGGGTADRTNGDGRTRSLLGTFRLARRRSALELRGDYLDVERGLPGSVVQPTVHARQDEHRLGAGATVRQTTGAVEWRADLDAGQGEVRYADSAPPARPPYRDSVRVRQLQTRLEASRPWDRTQVSFGAEARWLGVRATSLTTAAPGTERVLAAWTRLATDVTIGRTTATLSAGARLDRDVARDETRLSPSVTLGIPLPGATVQLGWSSAFAPPTLADQFFQPGVLARPNPELGAERVRSDWQAQITSGTLRIGGLTASGSLSLFRADVDGMILWFPDFRFVWSPDNYDVRRRGAELGLTVTVPVAGLALSASLSDVAVEYRGPALSGQVAYRPRRTGTATLEGTALGLRGSLRYRYTGERRTVPGSELNALEPFSVVDFQIARPVPLGRTRVELAIGLDDVFDRAGTMLVDYPAPGRTWRVGFTLTMKGPTDDELR